MIASFAGEDDHGCDVGSEGDAAQGEGSMDDEEYVPEHISMMSKEMIARKAGDAGAEDAMVDAALCSKTAVQICEALDALLIMGAVTGRTGSWEPLLRVVHGQKSGMRTNDYCTETNQEAVWWQARWECGCCNAHGSSPLQQLSLIHI